MNFTMTSEICYKQDSLESTKERQRDCVTNTAATHQPLYVQRDMTHSGKVASHLSSTTASSSVSDCVSDLMGRLAV